MKKLLCKFGIHDWRHVMVKTIWASRIFVWTCHRCGKEKK